MRRASLLLLLCACGGDWSDVDLFFASALPARSSLRAPDGGAEWNVTVDALTAMSEQSRTLAPLTHTDTSRTWGPYNDSADATRELQLVIDRTGDAQFDWRVETRVSGGAWLRVISARAELDAGTGVIDSPIADYRDSVTSIDAWKPLDAVSLRYGARVELTLTGTDGGVTRACWTTREVLPDCG